MGKWIIVAVLVIALLGLQAFLLNARNQANERELQALRESVQTQQKAVESLQQKLSSQLQAHDAALERGLNNQRAVLERVVGKNIPVQLPDDVLSEIAAKEAIVLDPARWPEKPAEAGGLRQQLAAVTKRIPPWAEEDILPRLNRLRWCVQLAARLAEAREIDGEGELGTVLDDLKSLESSKPDDIPDVVTARLLKGQEQFLARHKAAHLKVVKSDAAEALKGGDREKLAAAWTALDPLAGDDDVKRLKTELRQRIIERECDVQCDQLRAKLVKVFAMQDETLRQAGVSQVYDAALAQRLGLKLEDSVPAAAEASLVKLMRDCENDLRAMAGKRLADQQAEQGRKLRAYQKWALDQVKEFKKEYAYVEWVVANEDSKHRPLRKPGWQDANYQAVRDAMGRRLLPVNTAILDQAVNTLYSSAYDMGWNKLRDGERLSIAEQGAIVVKVQPDAMK